MQERRLSHSALMAEAKEAFNKLLADAQLARKGGRPRTNPLPPGARPPVKPAVPVAAAPVEPVKEVETKQARRKTDKGQSKAPAKAKKTVTASAKKVSAKPVKKSQAKRAKPQPKQSIRSKKSR